MLKKSEVISKVAAEAEVSKKDVEAVLNAYSELLVSELKVGEKFTIPNVGSIVPTHREARMGRNPATGENKFYGEYLTNAQG